MGGKRSGTRGRWPRFVAGSIVLGALLLVTRCEDNDPRVPRDGALETGALAAIASTWSIQEIAGVASAPGGEGGGGAIGVAEALVGIVTSTESSIAGAVDGLAGGESAGCPGGGTVAALCERRGSSSVFRFTFDACREATTESGRQSTRDGGVEIVVPVADACDTGFSASSERSRVGYESLTVTEVDTAASAVTARTLLNGTLWRESVGGATAPGEVVESAETPGTLLTWEGNLDTYSADRGLDFSLSTRLLELFQEAGTTEGGTLVTANGTLSVDTPANRGRLQLSLVDLRVDQSIDAEGDIVVSISGTARSECLGDIVISTSAALLFPASAACPRAGELIIAVQESGGGTSRVLFREDGTVDLDVGDDGVIDRTVSDCRELQQARECL